MMKETKIVLELTFSSDPTAMDQIGMDGLYVKSIERLPTDVRDAVEAWRDWFTYSGEPWVDSTAPMKVSECFFCGAEEPDHGDDCAFISAQKLLRPQT